MIINIWILIARHCCKNFSNIVSFDLHNSPTRWVSIVCYFQMRKQSFAWGVGTSGWPSNLDNLSLELPLTTTSLCALGGNPQPGGARCRENVLYQGWLSVLLGTSDPWPERPGFKFGFPHLQTVVIAGHCFSVSCFPLMLDGRRVPTSLDLESVSKPWSAHNTWELSLSSQWRSKDGMEGLSPLPKPETHTSFPACLSSVSLPFQHFVWNVPPAVPSSVLGSHVVLTTWVSYERESYDSCLVCLSVVVCPLIHFLHGHQLTLPAKHIRKVLNGTWSLTASFFWNRGYENHLGKLPDMHILGSHAQRSTPRPGLVPGTCFLAIVPGDSDAWDLTWNTGPWRSSSGSLTCLLSLVYFCLCFPFHLTSCVRIQLWERLTWRGNDRVNQHSI